MLTYMQKPLECGVVPRECGRENAGPIGSPCCRDVARQTPANLYPPCGMGDHIVIVNAEKIHLTGNKMATKLYRRHSGFPGGLKTATAQHVFRKNPTELLTKAVEGMLPKNPLGNHMAKKLRVYVGACSSAPGSTTGADYPVAGCGKTISA